MCPHTDATHTNASHKYEAPKMHISVYEVKEIIKEIQAVIH